jgi:hypothetical protein
MYIHINATRLSIVLDMKRLIINLFRQGEIHFSNRYIQQQRSIQTSTCRLQSVEEVNYFLIY